MYIVSRSWHLDTCTGSVVLHSMSIREKKRQSWSELASIQGELLNETFIIQKTSPTECRLVLFSQVDTRYIPTVLMYREHRGYLYSYLLYTDSLNVYRGVRIIGSRILLELAC